jgi:hypothetical protein
MFDQFKIIPLKGGKLKRIIKKAIFPDLITVKLKINFDFNGVK